jgi:hypothetical protein
MLGLPLVIPFWVALNEKNQNTAGRRVCFFILQPLSKASFWRGYKIKKPKLSFRFFSVGDEGFEPPTLSV